MTTPYDNPMWTHTHDGNLGFETNKPVVYLWRDPVDTVFSLLKLSGKPTGNKGDVVGEAMRYKANYEKWTTQPADKKVLLVSYEDLLSEPHEQLKRISEFFNVTFDLERSKMAFATVGGVKNTNEKNGRNGKFKNAASHTAGYKKSREDFRNRWKDVIVSRTNIPTRF
jgi:hypothetical protein